jgi:Fe-S cluster biogenesis protein NfuA
LHNKAKRPAASPRKKAVGVAKKSVIDWAELDDAVQMLRPALQSHGGDLEVVSVGTDDVTVRLKGACHGCPMAQVTLTQGVEKFLLKRVKGLKRVKSA